ncbi:heme/hemin ABC transporter substrate-binding protein [Roseivirga spongicola]|uniref:heme/hemin ABC transporter substrate-binding protein n=1 Tax=Roseivirga spongicola TaxID=333140 RepID=UPI002AC98BFF|nr:ABC transporter substrate-binding protein [Roseivirga spongicola]WPZ12388.1 ABC transporter substrate-binding protein [Roseivirga spongicola]
MNRLKIHLTILMLSLACTAQAQRIITAGSSSTEIVCELGLCDKIVATDRTSLYPPQMQSLPSIGYRTSITAEGIISLEPDVMILEKDYVNDVVLNQLKNAGQKVLVVENNSNLEDTKLRIRQIAAALNKKPEGEALIQRMETELTSLAKKVAQANNTPTVLCVYARGAGNLQVAGNDTGFMIIEMAGTQNAVLEISGYKPLNAEALINANPDYLLFMASGLESLGGINGVLKIPGVAQTTAGKKMQIIAIDGVKLTNWGPRLAEAALEIFEKTH